MTAHDRRGRAGAQRACRRPEVASTRPFPPAVSTCPSHLRPHAPARQPTCPHTPTPGSALPRRLPSARSAPCPLRAAARSARLRRPPDPSQGCVAPTSTAPCELDEPTRRLRHRITVAHARTKRGDSRRESSGTPSALPGKLGDQADILGAPPFGPQPPGHPPSHREAKGTRGEGRTGKPAALLAVRPAFSLGWVDAYGRGGASLVVVHGSGPAAPLRLMLFVQILFSFLFMEKRFTRLARGSADPSGKRGERSRDGEGTGAGARGYFGGKGRGPRGSGEGLKWETHGTAPVRACAVAGNC